MGLKNTKPKRSKDNKIKNSVKNKDGQQINKFREQTSEIRHSAKEPGKQNQIERDKTQNKICQINESAQVTDESGTDSEDSTPTPEFCDEICTARSPGSGNEDHTKISKIKHEWTQRSLRHQQRCNEIRHQQTLHQLRPYRTRSHGSSGNNETQKSRLDKIIAQGNIPRINRPAPPPPDVLD